MGPFAGVSVVDTRVVALHCPLLEGCLTSVDRAAMTYDKHMRARVLHHVDNYLGPGGFAGACDAAGKHYQVGATTARTWYEERETTGNVAPKRKRDGMWRYPPISYV